MVFAGTQKPAEPGVDDAVYPPPSSPEPLTYTASRIPEQQGAIKWEILKSIVYGGLTEAITSLSVVTSAASADAATCKSSDFLFCSSLPF